MNRSEILQKLAAGEITVDEATRLLREAAAPDPDPVADDAEAAPETFEKPKNAHSGKPRWLKIRVGSAANNRDYVKVNIPLGLVNAGMMFGARIAGKSAPDAWNEIMDAIDRGEIGTLVEVEDDKDGERVRIYVE